jgi:DNA-binding NarL/FixJ family response regulator
MNRAAQPDADKRKLGRTRDTLPPTELTRRHREILALISRGMSTDQIALEINLSPKTVDNHRTELSRRLGLRGPLSLIRFAASTKAAILLSNPRS